MARYIVHGALMKCTLGSTTAKIQVTSQQCVQIENKLVATENDKISMINIPSFGTSRAGSRWVSHCLSSHRTTF